MSSPSETAQTLALALSPTPSLPAAPALAAPAISTTSALAAPALPATLALAAPSISATPAPATPSLLDTSALAAPALDGVLGGRERIDAVDAQIVELIQRRIEISRQIQAARLVDGGRRVDLRRETEIIARYTAGLGRPGTTLAMALLELGRGRA